MIRPAKATDIAAIATIYNHYVTNTKVTFEEEPVTFDEMADRVGAVTAAGYAWVVADHNQSLAGYAYAGPFHHRSAYRFTAEISAYLAPDMITQGWGTKLYDALIPQLKECGQHSAIGVIALPNAASVALHEKFGMEKVAHFSEVGFKFGEWIDVGYWQLRL